MATYTISTTGTTITPSHPAWAHLDQIFDEDGDLLTMAAETVKTIKAALLSGNPVDAATLAKLCSHALRDIKATADHLGRAVGVMSGQPLND